MAAKQVTNATVKDLYPSLEPYNTFRMQVSPLHSIYVEESGNPKGMPVVFLHGGPGGGTSPEHRRFFNPKSYRIVLMDQRGCGESTPHAELRENTTWDLVADLEKIREHLQISKWHVFGGSWGSTLALAYAVAHPDRCLALILRGIFLCRPSELKWFYQEGASNLFPDYWETYWNYIPADERSDMMAAYSKRLLSEEESVRLEAARIWSKWEAATSFLQVSPEHIDVYEDPHKALAFARIENHYFMNNAFFETPNFLLEQMEKLRHIPGYIVQGRYDVVCPATSAWELHKAWPNSKLYIIPDAGHAVAETGTRSQLISIMNELAK